MEQLSAGGGGENAVEYFFKQGRIHSKDALEIIWYHAANKKAQMKEALETLLAYVRFQLQSGEIQIIRSWYNGSLFPTCTKGNVMAAFTESRLELENKQIFVQHWSILFVTMFRVSSVPQEGGDAHMIEADIIFGSQGPIMAHPPDTDSDNTLQNWLNEVLQSDKGIKLDFKSLSAVEPAMKMLVSMKLSLMRPVWINADILPGPSASSTARIAKEFLRIVTSYLPDVTLSLGWITSKLVDQTQGYTWEMVKEMEHICQRLSQPVTFPVRAALLRSSWPQLHWLLQQSERYSLTVWTARDDSYTLEDMLYIREDFDKSKIYYDLFEPQISALRQAAN